MVEYKNINGMNYIEYPELKDFRSLKFMMSIRNSMPLPDLMSKVADLIGQKPVTLKQVHGNDVIFIDNEFPERYSAGDAAPSADAMITGSINLPIAVYTADCLPVLLFDPKKNLLGLIHAGKAGTAKGIVKIAAEKMIGLFNVNARDVRAVIGPSIGPCCYEIDLWAENERQLKTAGINLIINPRVCTACNVDKYFSYRKEKGSTGRMISAAMLVGG